MTREKMNTADKAGAEPTAALTTAQPSIFSSNRAYVIYRPHIHQSVVVLLFLALDLRYRPVKCELRCRGKLSIFRSTGRIFQRRNHLIESKT